jgi:hypothetical protein
MKWRHSKIGMRSQAAVMTARALIAMWCGIYFAAAVFAQRSNGLPTSRASPA